MTLPTPSQLDAAVIDAAIPTCPLCHTVDTTVSSASLEAGATWVCSRCGQHWDVTRLHRVAAYLKYADTVH